MSLRHEFGVIGVDESGRCSLAGPVVAAAVLLTDDFDVTDLDDSKALTAAKRAELRILIEGNSRWQVARVEHGVIDKINILQATLLAMTQAVDALGLPDTQVLIDGNQIPYELLGRATSVIKGDATFANIAAASILAKEHRDEMMRGLALEYPGYGFENHFGYFAPEHRQALDQLGPCAIHRRSFSPIKEWGLQPCLMLD